MSLIRQVGVLIVAALLLAFAGGMVVSGNAMRGLLNQQLSLKNADNAQALALAVSQQGGDTAVIELLMSAQFDTGAYQSLRWRKPDGGIAFERLAPPQRAQAPAWLQGWVKLEAAPGVAQLSSGWTSLGQIEISSQQAYAYDALWQGLRHSAGLFALMAVVALALAHALLGRIRRPLDALVRQADALAVGQFVTVEPSPVQELRSLTEALNAMVMRIKRMFEAQTEQLGLLHAQAHCDALTGLNLRKHFLAELASALARDDGPPHASLLMLRLHDLARVNRLLGREATDQVLHLIGEVLQRATSQAHGSLAGRLNGADFALWLPAPALLEDSAQRLTDALNLALQRAGGNGGGSVVQLALGGVGLSRSLPLSQWFAQADAALAEAEHDIGDKSVVSCLRRDDSSGSGLPQGERAWRAQIEAALAQGHTRLLQYPVLDRDGHLLQWDCPLHLGLATRADGSPDFVTAAAWLPLALRTGLTAEVDLAAVSAALNLVRGDGQQRCVNVAAASLRNPEFLPRLRALLRTNAQAARQLGLEVDADAALTQFDLVQELSRSMHPLGVRVGLEHAGAQLQRIERLYQLGLDFVKLDRSVLIGVADDSSRAGFVRSLVILLHSLSLQVVAEGVDDPRDAQALLDCGLNGITGPWATGHQVR